MDIDEANAFLFNIAKEIKKSYESPIILFTMKDYADLVYRSLLEIRTALMSDPTPMQLAKIINNYHIDWLEAVNHVEDFRKKIKETPREVVLKAIDFTIKCMSHRCTYFNNFIQMHRKHMDAQDRHIIQADLEIMNDMKDTVTIILQEKKHCFQAHVDQTEYLCKVNNEIDELLNWLDRIYDSIAIQCCKTIHLHVPQLQNQLTEALKALIDEVAGPPAVDPSGILFDRKENKGNHKLRTMVRFDAGHELEASKVMDKIKTLEGRLSKLNDTKSSAVLALQHKVIYLEERLNSLENFRTSLQVLKMENSKELDEEDDLINSTEFHIFNHHLPLEYRCRLVEKLANIWETALYTDETGKSIISILSVADMNETYTDEIGEFTVDKYGRKIYSRGDGYYQLNERNELVEIRDDDKHVYYYDDCGRYYLDQQTRKRIYKAHSEASEYELGPTGELLKLKEVRDGIEYRFDHCGPYYINDEGQRIYIDPKTNEKYEVDPFGNLVRVHSAISEFYTCPLEPTVVEECKYLQNVVGSALKSCLANVILHQPADPIAFLADNLQRYKRNIEDRQKRRENEIQLKAERLYYETDPVPQLQPYGSEEGEASKLYDHNFSNYTTDYSYPTNDTNGE